MKKTKMSLFCLVGFAVAALALLATTPGFAACPEDIVAYWKLNETSGSSYADFIKGNDGTGNEAPEAEPDGLIEGAQRFNGTNDGIDVDASNAFDWRPTESFTIEFWLNTEGNAVPDQNQVIIGRDGDPMQWWVGLSADDGYPAYVFVDNATVPNVLNNQAGIGAVSLYDGDWHHVVLVRDAVNHEIQLYVDGDPVGAAVAEPGDFAGGFGSADGKLTIGYLLDDYYFPGLIDEVALYERALEQGEITAHYNDRDGVDYCGTSDAPSDAPYPDDTISLWPLDEGIGSTDYIDPFGENDGVGNQPPDAELDDGRVEGAQRFNGTNDGIDVTASSTFDWLGVESFTIEFWMNTESEVAPDENKVIIGRDGDPMQWWVGLSADDGYPAYVMVDNDGNLINKSTGVGNESLYDNDWHHIVLVRDAVNHEIQLYVDGDPVGAAEAEPNNFAGGFVGSATDDLTIGYLLNIYRFSGLIDEVALFDRALLEDEIGDHYDVGREGKSITTLRPVDDDDDDDNDDDDDDSSGSSGGGGGGGGGCFISSLF